jgi:histone H3/H4
MVDIIVKSKLKEVIKELRISADLARALNKKVEQILKEAEERAKANHRTTVMAQDI